MRSDDKPAAIEAEFLTVPERPAPASAPKSPCSQRLTADMQANRPAAMQAALLAKPDIVLDLLAYGLSEASGHVESIFNLRLGRPVNVPSIEVWFAREPRLDPSAYWQDGTRIENLENAFAKLKKQRRPRNWKT